MDNYQPTAGGVLVPDDFLWSSQTAPAVADRWMEDARRKLWPAEVESILVNALNGDLMDQQRLFATMADTWPRLQANLRTLRDAAKGAPFTVHAFTEDDQQPTPEDQEAADLVERALWGTRANVPRLEKSVEEMLAGLAEADVTGHDVTEILWRRNHRAEIVPRAYRSVGAGWFGYPPTAQGEEPLDRLMLRPGGPRSMEFADFPPVKYLVSIQPGHAGHPSVCATLRALAKYWIAAVFGVEWLMAYAQLFNVPFRWANYPANNPAAKAAVASMLSNIGTAGWAAFPEGVKLELKESTKAAGDLPSKLLMEVADTACDILILGQTLTSDAGQDGSGSFALGKVHAGVRRDRLESVCRAIAATLTGQLVPAVIRLNYGRDFDNYPEIRCDMPEAVDAKAEAERDKVLADLGLPMAMDWLYERHGVPAPAAGAAVLNKGTYPSTNPTLQQLLAKASMVQAAKAASVENQFTEDLADLYEEILKHAMSQGYEQLKLDNES